MDHTIWDTHLVNFMIISVFIVLIHLTGITFHRHKKNKNKYVCISQLRHRQETTGFYYFNLISFFKEDALIVLNIDRFFKSSTSNLLSLLIYIRS